MKRGVGVLIVVVVLCGGWLVARAQVHGAPAAPLLQWDPELDGIHVTYHPAADCSAGCWRLVSANYLDASESQLLHAVWTRVLDEHGEQIEGVRWHLGYPTGDSPALTKAAPAWSDIAMYGPGSCYDFTTGGGPHFAYAGDDPARTDIVRGLGLPQCQHVVFQLTWQWQQSRPQAHDYLPLVLSQHDSSVAITPVPTATGTPPAGGPTEPVPTATSEATPGASPTPTATPRPEETYSGRFVKWEPNCAFTQVKGTVRDHQGQPLAGVTVRVRLFGNQFGSPPVTDANGFYEFNRSGTADPLAPIDYTVAVIEPAGGQLLSNEVYVRTDEEECHPSGTGHQVATIDFQRNRSGLFVAGRPR